MMKKRIIILIAIFANLFAKAQEEQIIYTDFGNEGTSYEFVFNEEYDWTFDFDHDSVVDLYYHSYDYPNFHCFLVRVALRSRLSDSIQWWGANYGTMNEETGVMSYENPYGDTISSIVNWNVGNYGYEFVSGYWIDDIDRPYQRYIVFRVPQPSGFCYGWIEHSIDWLHYNYWTEWSQSYYDLFQPRITVYRLAYCTIPNYPLRVGQTNFDWGIDDDEATAFAILHPNPTTGQVTITGQDLKSAEVFNTLGQKVATARSEGETLRIDLSELPIGVYFVNITNKEGRKCVQKVVKE